jgi:hypothetical protein
VVPRPARAPGGILKNWVGDVFAMFTAGRSLPREAVCDPTSREESFMTHSLGPILCRLFAAAGIAALAIIATPATAATPKDTLVVAWAIDDIITMDPAESFEISAGRSWATPTIG